MGDKTKLHTSDLVTGQSDKDAAEERKIESEKKEYEKKVKEAKEKSE